MSSGYQPFLVANQRTSIDLGMDPWLTPPDAFQELLDGYPFRGVINKRDGYSWFDSIPHVMPNAASYQNIVSFSNGPNSSITLDQNHNLTGTYNVRFNGVLGFTSPTGLPPLNGTRWVGTFAGGNSFTINNDQAFGGTYTGSTGTASNFPGLPVMCIANWVDENNNIHIMAFDTRRASIYNSSAQALIPIGIVDQFTGTDANLFWWENYKGKIYFTNNVDSMFYWDSSMLNSAGLAPFLPEYDGSNTVDRCLMIKAIGSRLCLFNTTENGTTFPTRVRWCQDGASPVPGTGAGNPWDELTPGRGYFADLLDSSYIISLAKFQTNAFIMSSGEQFGTIYEMRPISDPKFAFAFVNVGTSRNINSTFGTILLDKIVTMVGNSGLIMTDGNNIARYDDKIPDFVLNDIDQENIGRCFGQRNDRLWQTWLLYPSGLPDGNNVSVQDRNDRVLIYNYQDNSWSVYRISMACLGVVDYPSIDPEWIDYGSSLADLSWAGNPDDPEDPGFGEETWLSTFQKDVPWLVGGDYSGNLWWMDDGAGDASSNTAYKQTSSAGNAITFSLTTRQWFPFSKEGQASQFGYMDLLIDGDADTDVTVNFQVDNQGNNYLTTQFSCFPYENILLAQIQNITLGNPTGIYASNHQISTGDTVWVYGVQGTTQLNDNSYIATRVDSNNLTLNVDSTTFGAYVRDGYLSPKPLNASPFWLRVFCGQTGVFHQFQLVSSGVDESFALHALLPWFKKSGRIYR